MDFYHVLPSNSCLNYFPNNNASKFSTPIDNPYVLPDEWEIALTNLCHSNCVYTFNNDKIIVEETVTISEVAYRTSGLLKVMLPVPSTTNPALAREILADVINQKFKTILELQMSSDYKHCKWNILNHDFYIIVSSALEVFYGLWSDVLTEGDDRFNNYMPFFRTEIPSKQEDLYIMLALKRENTHHKYIETTLKRANEKITPEELTKRINWNIQPGFIKMRANTSNQFVLEKLENDHHLLLLNEPFRKALTFLRRGMYHPGAQQHLEASFNDVKNPWTITTIDFKTITLYRDKSRKIVTLPPRSFDEEKEAIQFVNNLINEKAITFDCDMKKRVILNISDPKFSVTFEDSLRDIFAFDMNSYSGKQSHTAKGKLSLNRCIEFLYIYANIIDHVRVGNTEVPLLAIVPFSNTDKCSLLNEKTFKSPMYIRVSRDRISQIDIAIYDGAGQVVPFVSDAVTKLLLHFRQT